MSAAASRDVSRSGPDAWHPAERVALRPHLVDERAQLRVLARIECVELAAPAQLLADVRARQRGGRTHHPAQFHDVPEHTHAERLDQLPRRRTDRDADRRLARRRPFEHRPRVEHTEFLTARQIRVPRPRIARHRQRLDGRVLVAHDERERRADRPPRAHAARDFDAIVLDRHAPAAPIPALPPREFSVDALERQRHARRQPFEDRRERRPVRLTGRGVAEVTHRH
jgi:hypothetical protein